ncbi:RNA polymerase sigma factor [bacterium]|nr:RNA polymerase sigma factor [bacterium]
MNEAVCKGRLADLALRFQEGEHEAVHELVAIYSRRIQAFVRTIVHSPELAEELTQDVFVRAYTKRNTLANRDKLEAWLFALARNCALKEMKRKRYRVESVVDQDEIAERAGGEDAPPQPREVQEAELAELLDEALAQLDEKRRQLMTLRYYSHLGLAEIAEVMEMPIGSVGTTISRSLAQLKDFFQSRGFRIEDLMP